MNWRGRGRILIATGLFLIATMGALAWKLAPNALSPGIERNGWTFTGSAAEGQFLLGLLGALALFGLLCVANGGHMILTGRRSRRATAASLTLFFLFCALGLAVRRLA